MNPILAGVTTFLIATPVSLACSWIWSSLLNFLGMPVERQQLFDFFGSSKSTATLVLWTGSIVLLGPLLQELVFRAGLYRFLRGRTSSWASVSLSAIVFGFAHVDRRTANGLATFWPLVVLGVIFAIAYARTGNVVVVVIAHGLHNLAMLLLFVTGR